jgi:hypothetical protein
MKGGRRWVDTAPVIPHGAAPSALAERRRIDASASMGRHVEARTAGRQGRGEQMRVRHPFEGLTASGQARAFAVMALLAILMMVTLQVVGTPLQTDTAPSGIVSFELAGDLPTAQAILASWDQTTQIHAALSLGADYLFMLAYAAAIGLACVLVARNWAVRSPALAALGAVLAWAQWGAAALDALENVALIRLLLGSTREIWPAMARWCAIPKFALVAAGLLYAILGALAVMALRARRT